MFEYKTIKKEAFSEFIERKSRFIGYAKPVTTEEEAVCFINKIKSINRKAKHNVYAYSILKDNISRFSDDGEPQGTAGIPVLDYLKKLELANVVVVVTRYFGGVLLGTGGLVRAYFLAAKLAVESSEIITMQKAFKIKLVCKYNQYDKIISIICEALGSVDNVEFSDNITIYFHVSKDDFNLLKIKICEATSGDIQFNVLDENFYQK